MPDGVTVIPGVVSFSERPLDVEIRGSGLTAATLPTVNVESGPSLQVRCGDGPSVKLCTLKDWKAVPNDPSGLTIWRSQVVVSSQTDAKISTAKTWFLRFMSPGIAQSQVGVTVQYAETQSPVAPGQWTPAAELPDGGFRGLVRLTPPDGTEIVLPVRAVSKASRIALYDETRLLSHSGVIPVARSNGSTERFEWYAPSGVELRLSGRVAGFTTTLGEILRNPKTGGLEGVFKITLVGTIKQDGKLGLATEWRGTFSLEPDAKVAVCASDAACDGGAKCNLGICTTGPSFATVDNFGSTLEHGDRAAWLSPAREAAIVASVLPPPSFVCAKDQLISNFYVTNATETSSGQTQCRDDNSVGRAFPFVQGGGEGATALIKECLTDLRRLPPPEGAAGTLFAKLGGTDYFQATKCVGLGNFLSALASSRRVELANDHAWLLAQWAQLHAFVARQGLAEQSLNNTVIGGGKPADASSVSYPQLLDSLERAWALIISGMRTGTAGSVAEWASDSSLANPDYRRIHIAPASRSLLNNPGHDQKAGLAPALCFAAADHLNLVSAYVSDEGRKVFGVSSASARKAVLDRYAEAMRSVALIQALAHGIYAKAVAACTRNAQTECEGKATPTWESRWRQSLAALVSARSALIHKAELYRQGRNPLGIEDDDTPLYFGDVQGEVSRFFAASTYLLEQAEKATTSASTSLEASRSAWMSSRTAKLQDDMQRMQMGFRIEDMERLYGQPIIDACGLEQTTASQLWKDIEAGKFYPQTCHVDPRCAGANPSPAGVEKPILAALGERESKLKLCRVAFAASRLKVTDGIKTCISGGASSADAIYSIVDTLTLENLGTSYSATCGGKTYNANELLADQGFELLPQAEQEAASVACEARYGGLPIPSAKFDPTCYHGQLGSAVARILTAKQEVKTAISRLQTAEVSFEKKWELCQLKIDNNTQRLAAQNTLNKQREAWREAKKLARDLERVADTVQGGLQGATNYAAIGAGTGAVIGSVVPGAGTAVGAGVGALAGAAIGGVSSWFGSSARQKQKKLDDELKLAETEYATLLENLSAMEDLKACINDADIQKSAITTEIESIKSQALAVDAALIDFANIQRSNVQKIGEGLAVLKKERERNWGGFAHHFWFDEKVQNFTREFPWAQRLTYLSLRAVEYELQQTLAARAAVIAANHPDQLNAALMSLHQQRDNLRVGGARPAQSVAVVSLRDDLLGITNNANATNGLRPLTSGARFASELTSSSAEVRNLAGNYLGQGFAFSLTPTTRGLSRTSLPNRCAERLWQVTATVVGDGISAGSTRIPVQLRKRNTFSSQMCASTGGLQTASIQPSKNLLKPDALGVAEEKADYTDAAILAPLNVPRSQFESDAFSEGLSSEMAGYGFYGDYVLFFPKASTAGLDLTKVEDVLLRFTYLSVDGT
jgi:hypothetical protein